MSKNRLGKGLEALFPQLGVDEQDPVTQIEVNELRPNPFQPRRVFDQGKLQELANSIEEHGIIQPLVVRKSFNGYEIVAGERRWRAAKLVKLQYVPVVVREFTDIQLSEIALIENLQREDLNPIEIAEAYSKLMENFNLTQEELAKKVGQSRSHVANYLRLTHLPKEVRDYVSRGTITMGHARAILGLQDESQQKTLAQKITEEDLSVRVVEQLVNRLSSGITREPKRPDKKNSLLKQYEDQFRSYLGTSVRIQQGKKRGKIEIDFFSPEDLERIIQLISEVGDSKK
ncbi:ParB/RepB/Spo0J family partition protein [Fodinisporobacter ferrooxydans]|uniref:ParB/RepB/Spo0J family partition protein n=1 Tax=Fodinisporobacter ferrooxydans TaxID=2901836 RepID=A0ABY4CQP1_9BACL|nr:ParB/RepB/Spo0J family partition protein [Alicyclobacillaceae bacterium MYW30-H2]